MKAPLIPSLIGIEPCTALQPYALSIYLVNFIGKIVATLGEGTFGKVLQVKDIDNP